MITFVESDVAISDAVWDEWLAAFIAPPGKARLLTSMGDIQPTKEQWRRATRMMRDANLKIAVVTESRPTSALAKAASWAGVDMQAFRWEHLYEASLFIGVDSQQRPAVRASVIFLRDCFGAVDGAAMRQTPMSPFGMTRATVTTAPRTTAAPRTGLPVGAQVSKTPMADAASQNLAQVRQTSEEIQAKLAEVQARLRSRTRS